MLRLEQAEKASAGIELRVLVYTLRCEITQFDEVSAVALVRIGIFAW